MKPALLGALLAAAAPGVSSQAQAFGAGGQPAPQPLDNVVMQVFDKSHDGKISLQEVTQTLDAFAGMAPMMGGGDPSAGPSEVEKLLRAAKSALPQIFALLDADDSRSLSAEEVRPLLQVQRAFKSGALRNLTRAVFEAADADNDASLST